MISSPLAPTKNHANANDCSQHARFRHHRTRHLPIRDETCSRTARKQRRIISIILSDREKVREIDEPIEIKIANIERAVRTRSVILRDNQQIRKINRLIKVRIAQTKSAGKWQQYREGAPVFQISAACQEECLSDNPSCIADRIAIL